jgi:DNA-directed RNA polymerase subunit RPC12/RpoP
MTKRIANEELIEDLQRVAEEVGHPPTTREYREHGQHKYETLSKRWGSWDAALEAAEMDPNRRGPDSSGLPVVCPNCGHRQRYGGERDIYDCSECATTVPIWRGQIGELKRNDTIRQLATGPKTHEELGDHPLDGVRRVVDQLSVPLGRGNTKSRAGSPTTVYYLYGDERAAIRVFIDVNEEYLADILSDQRNPLQSQWDDHLYELLIQEWEWLKDE